jgi:hypothetical protein
MRALSSPRHRVSGDRPAFSFASRSERRTRDGAREVVQYPGRQVPAGRGLGLEDFRADREPGQHPARYG